MTTVVATYAQETGRPIFICDFSPPRGGDPALLEPARALDVDFISVAYNPGKSARVNSAAVAHWIQSNTSTDAIFTLATRDMNKVAIQSLLLGAQLLGLENLVVVKGDEFNERDLAVLAEVNDYIPTGLIRAVAQLNDGIDFRGLKLRGPTRFCIGATVDLGRDLGGEIALTRRKAEAGAHFLISQPTFGPDEPAQFLDAYAEHHGEELALPMFQGIQVMTAESIQFGSIPEWVTDDLGRGRPGTEIAVQVLEAFVGAGFRSFYLVPPILRGGRRDYEAAQAVLEAFRS